MTYNYPQAGPSTSRSTQFPFVNDATAEMPFETDVLNYLYEGLDQMSYGGCYTHTPLNVLV